MPGDMDGGDTEGPRRLKLSGGWADRAKGPGEGWGRYLALWTRFCLAHSCVTMAAATHPWASGFTSVSHGPLSLPPASACWLLASKGCFCVTFPGRQHPLSPWKAGGRQGDRTEGPCALRGWGRVSAWLRGGGRVRALWQASPGLRGLCFRRMAPHQNGAPAETCDGAC